MKKISRITLFLLLIFLCIYIAFRWRAWFVNPPEMQWTEDTLTYHFLGFGEDSLKNFVQFKQEWQDIKYPTHLDILILGDIHNSLTREQYNQIYKRHPQIDCYAQLGDFVERNYFYYFQMLYKELKGTPFDSLPIINCPGNHEYKKGIRKVLLDNWRQTFHQPTNGPSDFVGTTYYIDFPHLRFIVINTTGLQQLRDFTRVQMWTKKTLQEAGEKFTIVMMHHPVYSCGGRQNFLIKLFFKHILQKADIVFAGHDHSYARRLPFVNTNIATKFYLNQLNERDDRVACGVQVYNLLSLSQDTLTMQTFLLHTGSLYDKVQIIKKGQEKERIDFYPNKEAEIILLPEQYKNKNTRKIKNFLNKKSDREKGSR